MMSLNPNLLQHYLAGNHDDLGPFSETPCLVVNAESVEQYSDGKHQPLPCPVLGIGPLPEHASQLCDVIVQSENELGAMLNNIKLHPMAATVLVQTLRSVEQANYEDGLLIESLAYATLQAGPEYQNWLAEYDQSALTPIKDTGPAVLLERNNKTLTLQLNRASRRNAISVEMRDALCEAFELALLDSEIERISISGKGACFSTGGDLEEFGQTPDAVTGHMVRSLRLPGKKLARCAETMKVTAHVHSACIGAGIELAAFADTIIAQSDSFFQLPELKFGLIPGAGGCVSLVKRIGRQRASEICLSGKKINAKRALEIGLIDKIQLN